MQQDVPADKKEIVQRMRELRDKMKPLEGSVKDLVEEGREHCVCEKIEDDLPQLPDGWAWTKLGEITCDVDKVEPEKNPDKEFIYLDIASIDNTRQIITNPKKYIGKDAPSRARQIIKSGDILFSTVRTYLKNLAMVNQAYDNQIASTGFCVVRPVTLVDNKFIFFLMQANGFLNPLTQLQRGSSYPAVRNSDVLSQLIPLPPLGEQRRIVAKLEQLLSRVQACQERLEKIPQILKRFRQSVLAAACSGRLTEDWREKNPDVEPAEELPIENVAVYLGGYAFPSKRFQKYGNHQVLRIGNIKPGHINLDIAPVFISEDDAGKAYRFALQEDDILISMTGTKYKRDYGFAGLVPTPTQIRYYLNQRVGRLRCKSNCLAKYLYYWLQTESFRDFFFKEETGNVNQGNVGANALKLSPIYLPPLAEQHEIVRRVEALFQLADRIETRYQQARSHVDQLTQSILAKAFRGELVPQDPKDEPASMLIEKIRQERAAQQKPARATKKTRQG